MTRVLIAALQPHVRAALQLLVIDLHMEVVGEAENWSDTFNLTSKSKPDMLVVDGEIIPTGQDLNYLRTACPHDITIVLISPMQLRQQTATSAGADIFISKGEMPDQVADHLKEAAAFKR